MPARHDVLVVGGGIAGLAAAHALASTGARVSIVEQAPAWRPVGAGIVLARNAMAVLDHLGVGGAVRERARVLPAAAICDAAGTPLLDVRDGATLVAIHRADLHDALLEDLQAAVHMGTTVETLVPGRRVGVGLSDGASLEVDVVLGADGIRSRVRDLVLGAAAPPVVPAGYVAWRAVLDDPTGLDRAIEQWGHGRRVGAVPLADGRLYTFLVEDDTAADTQARPSGIGRRFGEFADPARTVIEELETQRVPLLRHPVEELAGVAYGRGNVALIGDAAHAMTPNLGQGAAQALEDVPAVVRALAEQDHTRLAEAVAAWRHSRVRTVVRRSAATGRIGQLDGRVAVALRDRVLRSTPRRVAVRQAGSVTDHDPLPRDA